MRITLLMVTLLTLGGAWGQGSAPTQTLVERLNLGTLAALNIVTSQGDATHATYRLVSLRGIQPVLGAVEKKLLSEGWASHPNLNEGEDGAAGPGALLPGNIGRQLRTYAQGAELLEVLAAPVGRSNFVSLQFNLISAEPERPVAGQSESRL